MKKKIVMMTLGLMMASALYAQEYKVAKSTGKLIINEVNEVVVEGYSGNEIIFVSRDHDRDDDNRAKGLKAVSGSGLDDNTGIGLSVIEKGDVIEVNQIKKNDGPSITIKVPKGVKVSYSQMSPNGEDFEVKNFEGELEVSMLNNNILLTNVSGPMEIKSINGDIDASFGGTIKGPIVLESVNSHIDISMPTTTKANLKMSTSHGEMFVDPDFKIEVDKSGGNYTRHSDTMSGKLNGGGTAIELISTNDNIYLRKK